MNAQERQMIDELFDRLSKLEAAPRDAEAEAAIRDGLRRAPNAVYPLVQTVLLQDEALKRANARIEELEAGTQGQTAQSGGFLDSMRETLLGSQQNRGSVPNVRPQDTPRQDASRPIWNSGQVNAQVDPRYASGPGQVDPRYAGGPGQVDPRNAGGPGYGYSAPYGSPPGAGGSSFLGTAAAAAAGAIGGSLLMNSIHGLTGGHQAFADSSAFGGDTRAPSTDQSNSSLAHDAGVDDIGHGGRDANDSRQGFVDQASNEDNDTDNDDYNDDGFDSGGSDVV